MMDTETLIQHLTRDRRPAKPIDTPAIRFTKWMLASISLLFAGVMLLRPRPDIATSIYDPAFVFPALAMLCLTIVCTFSAFVLAVPDLRRLHFGRMPIAVVAFWFCLVAFLFSTANIADSAGPGWICVTWMVGLALPPGSLLFILLKRAAPMRAGLIGLLAAIGSLAVAEIGVQFLCQRSEFGSHLIVWHLLPLTILAAAGIVLGKLIFNRGVSR